VPTGRIFIEELILLSASLVTSTVEGSGVQSVRVRRKGGLGGGGTEATPQNKHIDIGRKHKIEGRTSLAETTNI
jgi:hypothetical protein